MASKVHIIFSGLSGLCSFVGARIIERYERTTGIDIFANLANHLKRLLFVKSI